MSARTECLNRWLQHRAPGIPEKAKTFIFLSLFLFPFHKTNEFYIFTSAFDYIYKIIIINFELNKSTFNIFVRSVESKYFIGFITVSVKQMCGPNSMLKYYEKETEESTKKRNWMNKVIHFKSIIINGRYTIRYYHTMNMTF